MESIKPIINEPALVLEESATKRFLVIADLHLGIEHTLIEKGVQIPTKTQTQLLITKLKRIVKRVKPTDLIILGDVKHSVPTISPLEWHVVPMFFEKFRDFPLHIVMGNHDSKAQIEGLSTRNVIFHPAQGFTIELQKRNEITKVGLFHGHSWPGKELFNVDFLIMAHNHPAVEFKDELNVRTYEPAWIRAHWDKAKVIRAYLKYLNIKKPKKPEEILKQKFKIIVKGNPEILIMPAFNDLIRGIPFNQKDAKFIGPLLKSNCLNIEDAEVILLDGTILGKLKEIYIKDQMENNK